MILSRDVLKSKHRSEFCISILFEYEIVSAEKMEKEVDENLFG